jgi:hypothetical protein
MVKRRALLGTSLLVGSAGVVVVSCGGGGDTAFVSGNLVAPPMFDVCVTVEPAEADVLINDSSLNDVGCAATYEGEAVVKATAEGFVPYEETLIISGDRDHAIVMTAEGTTP